MAFEDAKSKRFKAIGYGKQAYIAKLYGGKPSEEARRNFYRPAYQTNAKVKHGKA